MQPRAPYPSALRVSGRLTADARLVPGTATRPNAFLFLPLAPAQGLPYRARVDLGADVADHMAAEALLPALRCGALVSVGGSALQLRTEHGSSVLSIQQARHVVLLQDPTSDPTPAAPAPEPAHAD